MCVNLSSFYKTIFIFDGTKLYRKIACIPTGTNYSSLVADLFLFCYQRDFFCGVLFSAVLFFHEIYWMRSGTELSQFLRIFPTYTLSGSLFQKITNLKLFTLCIRLLGIRKAY